MIKSVYSLCICMLLSFISCGESHILREAESLLETDPAAADSVLSSIQEFSSNRNRALYAVLKTQADYKQYKPITTDSLILTATSYYGTHRKKFHAALAWYTQGCVYSELHNEVLAIDAYIKAKDLFPDTLVRYYALVEQTLGRSYLSKGMYEDSYNSFLLCRNNADRLKDSAMLAYADYNLALIKLQNSNFEGLDKAFSQLSENKHLSDFYREESLLQLAKYHIYSSCRYDSALFYLDRIKKFTVSFGAAASNLKGKSYHMLENNDSAYLLYKQSLNGLKDIYTLCDSYRRLSELSLLYGTSQEAYNYSTLYTYCLDSIRTLRNANDVAKKELSHKVEIENIKRKEFRIRTIITSTMIVIVLLVVIILIYQSHINRVNSNYIKFCDNVWTEINTPITTESTDGDCFLIGKAKYMNSPSHNILLSLSENKSISRNEKEAIKHDLSVAFSDLIVRLLNTYPSINNREVQTCLLSALGVEKHVICKVLDMTDDNYRTMKRRLKDKLGSSYSFYFG